MDETSLLQLGVSMLKLEVTPAGASTPSRTPHARVDPPRTNPALASRPEYHTLLEHMRSHLSLIPPLDSDDPFNEPVSTTEGTFKLSTFLNPNSLAELDLDRSMFLLVFYVSLLDCHKPSKSQAQNRVLLQEMIENGLISHAMAALTLCLKHDDRPPEEVAPALLGWVGAFKLVVFISYIFTSDITIPDEECSRFCLRWRDALGPPLEALLEHEAVWSSITLPAARQYAPALDVCTGLAQMVHPQLLYVGLQYRSDGFRPTKHSNIDPVTRSAVHIVCKLRGALIIADGNFDLDAILGSRIAVVSSFLITSLIKSSSSRPDVFHLTGLSMEEFVEQCVAFLPLDEQTDPNRVADVQHQLLPLRTFLETKNLPKSWATAFSRTHIFSRLVHRVRGLLLRLMAKDFSVACETFKTEMASTSPTTPLNAYMEILSGISVVAERHASWDLYAEMSGPEALSVAEMVAFVNGGELKYVYWAVYLPGAIHGDKSNPAATRLLKDYTPSLRLLAVRARLHLNDRPEAFPAMSRRLQEHVPGMKLWDGLYSYMFSSNSNGSGGMGPASRTSNRSRSSRPTSKGPMGKVHEELKSRSVWEVMYEVLKPVQSGQPFSDLPGASPRSNEVCAAVGCLSLEPPQTMCGGCKKVYFCSRECQRRNWKWHKPTCHSNRAIQ